MTDVGACFPHRVTFHDGCHGLRELGIKQPPRQLLQAVRGLELIEMDEAETCCGFGGTFGVKFPMISTAMGEVKCDSAVDTGADFLVSNDSSCLMQIQGFSTVRASPSRTIHSPRSWRRNHEAKRASVSRRRHAAFCRLETPRDDPGALKKYEVARDARRSMFQDYQAARSAPPRSSTRPTIISTSTSSSSRNN